MICFNKSPLLILDKNQIFVIFKILWLKIELSVILVICEIPYYSQDDKEIYEFDTNQEEELHVAIAELIGVLFKTHKDICGQLYEYIYNKFLPLVL